MEPRTGRVVNGAVILDDADDLVDGSYVTVWIGEPDAALEATDDELVEIDLGVESAAAGELLDARVFLAEPRI